MGIVEEIENSEHRLLRWRKYLPPMAVAFLYLLIKRAEFKEARRGIDK